MRAAREYLNLGGDLGVAPEGTRCHTGGLMSAKTGAAYLANLTSVPIIPFAITGTDTAVSKLKQIHRPLLKVRIGDPFTLPPIDRCDRNMLLERYTDEIMCRIAAMLPAEYRGIYSDHPRLREILPKNR